MPAVALGQDYPTQPINIYTAQAEGTADITARIIAEYADLGQPVVIMNRPSILAAQTVADATPNGYSLLVLGKSFYLSPIFQETPYDPVADFAPIARLTSSPNILVTHPSLPESLEEIIELARANPGTLNYAAGASGGAAHLAAEQFQDLAGVEMERVVYSGGGPSMVGVMTNESQISFGTSAMISGLVDSGNLRAVAVTSSERSDVAPGLPTVSEILPGFEETSTQGIWTTAGTPPEVIAVLSQEIERILALPEVQERLLLLGADAAFTTPEEFADEIDLHIELTERLMEGVEPD